MKTIIEKLSALDRIMVSISFAEAGEPQTAMEVLGCPSAVKSKKIKEGRLDFTHDQPTHSADGA